MSRDDDRWHEPFSRKRTALRILQRIMRELKPVPGYRLSADGKSLIPCRRHIWDWAKESIRRCRHCGALKRDEY